MENVIIKTKFIPPSLPQSQWTNKKLWKKYDQILNYPLTIVKAGPGYGKSTTLASYFKENFEDGFYWYSIDELDADPALFFVNLIHAFKTKKQKDDIAENFIEMINMLGKQEGMSLRHIVDYFANEFFSCFDSHEYLIIDDFHLISKNQRILNLFSLFIDHVTPRLHIVISTRESINFKKWPAWRLKRKILTINEEDLSLNKEEIKDFLNTTYNIKIKNKDIKKIHKKTEGWIMAIDLIGEGLNNGASLKSIIKREKKSLELLFQYLAFEVLDNLDSETRDFLLKSAVLKYLRPRICNKLLNIDNSEEILQYLNDRRLFVYTLGNNQYRYHHLFHEFLHNQGQKKYDYKLLHQKTSDICQELGEKGFAIYHSLEAQNYEQAADLILSSAQKLLETGRIETLQASLNRLPESMFNRYPSLYLYQGDIYRIRSYFNKALDSYQKAKCLFEKNRVFKKDDTIKLTEALKKIALVYLDTVQPIKAKDYLNKALEYGKYTEMGDDPRLLKLVAENKANEGQLKEAELLQKQANEFSNSDSVNNNCNARIKLRTGRLDEAKLILEKKLNKEKKSKRVPQSHRESILILSLIHSFKGEPNPAKNYAQGGIKLSKQFYSPFIKAISYMRLGHAYQLFGRHRVQNSRDVYQEAIKIIDDFMIPRGKAEPLMGLSLLEAFYGNSIMGIKYGKEGLKIAQKAGDEWITGLIKIALGVNHFFADELEEAEKTFLNNCKNFLDLNDNFCLAICKSWLSLIYYYQQAWDKFSHITEELMNLTKRENFDYIFLKSTLLGSDHPNLFTPLLIEARERGIYQQYVKGLLAELGLSNLEHHPGYTLKIKTFGNLRVWRGKKEISKKEWKREKARELFLLLLIHRGELVPKEKLYYYLWPEKNDEKAAKNFKVTLNALKKALEPNRKARQNPFFINRRGSSYGFNSEAGYIYDVERFEGLIEQGDNTNNIEEQIKLYQDALDLYEDDFIVDKLYLDWIRNERERLKHLFLNTADKLMTAYFKKQKYEKCLEITNKILEVDNCWEKAYLFKMKSYNNLDRRSMAIKVYKKCKRILDRELNVFPSVKIEKYYQNVIQN